LSSTDKGGVVLVIDDDQDIREAVVDTLTEEGYAAIALADGASALTYLREQPLPVLVLLDWNMTPMNAAQFMAEIAKEPAWSTVPVVLLSADARLEDKAKQARFVGYLKKPVRLPELFRLTELYCE
jgi:CheY-like chemotaxis protein